MTEDKTKAEIEAMEGPWVVLCVEHGQDAWWRADRSGYSTNLLGAGIYTEAEAKEISVNRKSDLPFQLSERLDVIARWGKGQTVVRWYNDRITALIAERDDKSKRIAELEALCKALLSDEHGHDLGLWISDEAKRLGFV